MRPPISACLRDDLASARPDFSMTSTSRPLLFRGASSQPKAIGGSPLGEQNPLSALIPMFGRWRCSERVGLEALHFTASYSFISSVNTLKIWAIAMSFCDT